jgi:outer membrane lipoprotein-sorting protein
MVRASIVAVVLAIAGTAAAQPTPTSVLNSVDQASQGITSATVKFKQTVTTTAFGTDQVTHGVMMIERPGKMRWDYYSKPHKKKVTVTQTFITDGTTLTAIDTPNLQVVQGPLCANAAPAAMSFLTGSGTLASSFTPELGATTSSTIELVLTPKQPSAQFTKMVLTVDATSYEVQKSVVTDRSGNTTAYELTNFDKAATIKASLFQVSLKALAKKGYKVVQAAATCPTNQTSGAGSGSGSGSAPAAGSSSTTPIE